MSCDWFCLDPYVLLRWTMFKLHVGKKMMFQFLIRCSTTIYKIFYDYLAIASEIIVNIWQGWDLFSLRNHNIYIHQQPPVSLQISLLAFSTYELNKLWTSWHFQWLIHVDISLLDNMYMSPDSNLGLIQSWHHLMRRVLQNFGMNLERLAKWFW